MKKIIVLLVVLLLLALTVQVAFADPNPPPNPNGGSCNMVNSWWAPLPYGGPAPGNADAIGVEEMVAEDYNTGELIDGVQQRGMAMAHYNQDNPQWPSNGALNMDAVTIAHCG